MCENVLLLVIFNIVDKIILVAKIALPIIIMVMGVIDFLKSVTDGNPETIKKELMALLYRFLASVAIFFLPTIVNSAMNLVNSYDKENNASCLLNVDGKTISKAKIKRAEKAVKALEDDLSYSNYSVASRYVNKVDDESSKLSLQGRLAVCKDALDKIKKEKDAGTLSKAKAYAAAAAAANMNIGTSPGGVDNVFNLPYYDQCEEAYNPISTSIGNYKTCDWGCGYVALAMIVDGLTGANGGPPAVIKALYPHMKGTAMPDSAMEERNVSQFGLTSTLLFPRQNKQSDSELENRKKKIVEALGQGYAIELLAPGHFITLAGIKDGKITVLDPGHRERNGQYTIDELVNKYFSRSDYTEQTGFVTAYGFKKK